MRHPTNVCQGLGKISISSTVLSSRAFTYNLDPSGLVYIPVQLRPLTPGKLSLTTEVKSSVMELFGVKSPRVSYVLIDGSEHQVLAIHVPMPNENLFQSFGKTYDIANAQFLLELSAPLVEVPKRGLFLGQEETVSQHRGALRSRQADLRTTRPLNHH